MVDSEYVRYVRNELDEHIGIMLADENTPVYPRVVVEALYELLKKYSFQVLRFYVHGSYEKK